MTSTASMTNGVKSVLRRHAADSDDHARFPVESLRALREEGLLGILVPKEYGGPEESLRTFTEVASNLAESCLSTAQIWAMHCFQVDAIVRYGSAELKADLLPRIAAGAVYLASVTSERGRSASLFSATSPLTLTVAGDRVVIDRFAPVVTGGNHADGYLITMRASADASEHEVSLVYADRSDLRTQAVGEWNTLGMRATESIGMVLEGSVPAHNVVGPPGGFAEIARESMIPLSHLGWAACWLGAARGALAELVRLFAKQGRSAGGAELFHERVGHIRVDLELVSAYLTRVRERVDCARTDGRSLADPRTQLYLNTLKLAASELTFRAVDRMVQLAGLRIGYARDAPIALERHFRDLRSASLNHGNDGLWVGVGALAMLDRSVELI